MVSDATVLVRLPVGSCLTPLPGRAYTADIGSMPRHAANVPTMIPYAHHGPVRFTPGSHTP